MSIEGPWLYRPQEHDDWGTVRASNGGIVCQVRFPYRSVMEIGAHRNKGTDPWEEVAKFVASAPDLYEALEHITDLFRSLKPLGEDTEKEMAVTNALAALARARGENVREGADK